MADRVGAAGLLVLFALVGLLAAASAEPAVRPGRTGRCRPVCKELAGMLGFGG
jgi:hypothetical protein